MANNSLKKDIKISDLTSRFKKQKTSGTSLGGIRQFNYTAISNTGIRLKGKMSGATSEAVAQALAEDGWVPLKIEEILNTGFNLDIGNLLNRKPFKLNLDQLSTFSRQLSELLTAGVPISRCLSSIGEESDPVVSRLCLELQEKLSAGVPFSEALADFPDAFDEVFCAYVASGEASGTLPETMGRLAKVIIKRSAVRKKIKSVMAYPKYVSMFMVMIIAGILTKLVPIFVTIYKGYHKPLPGPTAFLVKLTSNATPFRFTSTIKFLDFNPADNIYFLQPGGKFNIVEFFARVIAVVILWGLMAYLRSMRGKESKLSGALVKILVSIVILFLSKDWVFNTLPLFVILPIVAIFFGLNKFFKDREDIVKYAKMRDQIMFRLPVFGELNQKNALFRWTATLSGGISSGVPLSRAIQIAARTSGSVWHKAVAPKLDESLRAGRGLATSLGDYRDLYPGNLRSMVSTGEQTGEIGLMLDNLATIIDNDIDSVVAGLSAKIEVMLLVVMGVVVGGLVLILYLPIIQLASAQSGGI